MNAILAIDKFLGKPWERIGTFLCWLSGKSSLFWAQFLLGVSAFFGLLITLNGGVAPYICFLLLPFYLGLMKLVSLIDKETASDTSVLSAMYVYALTMRFKFTGIAFWCATLLDWRVLWFLLMAGSFYLATQNRPRGDSAFKKALGWLKGRRLQLRLPSPAPNPT